MARCESSPDRVFLFRAECRWGVHSLQGFSTLLTLSATLTGAFLQARCNREVCPNRPPLRSPAEQSPKHWLQPAIAPIRAGNSLVSCRFQFWNSIREPIKVYRFPIQNGHRLKAYLVFVGLPRSDQGPCGPRGIEASQGESPRSSWRILLRAGMALLCVLRRCLSSRTVASCCA